MKIIWGFSFLFCQCCFSIFLFFFFWWYLFQTLPKSNMEKYTEMFVSKILGTYVFPFDLFMNNLFKIPRREIKNLHDFGVLESVTNRLSKRWKSDVITHVLFLEIQNSATDLSLKCSSHKINCAETLILQQSCIWSGFNTQFYNIDSSCTLVHWSVSGTGLLLFSLLSFSVIYISCIFPKIKKMTEHDYYQYVDNIYLS